MLMNTLNSGKVNPVPSSIYEAIQLYSSIEVNAYNDQGTY